MRLVVSEVFREVGIIVRKIFCEVGSSEIFREVGSE